MHEYLRVVVAGLVSAFLALPSWADTNEYEEEFGRFEKFLTNNPVGRNGDAWLEIINAFGTWEPVVLVFGYPNDLSVCKGLIADLQAADRLPREARCTRVGGR